MNKKPKYYLNKEGEFVIENYHRAKPFSSFFPGIAGVWGIPLWVFYVNRGQAIASFGIKDKDHPIMEFQPANKAYQLVSLLGFRTLIKVHSGKKIIFYDAFHNGATGSGFEIENKMSIVSYELRLKEINHTLGLETEIEYFTIPNDNYGALVRKLSLKNTARKDKDLELLDGLPQVIPYGLSNMFLKKLSRTVEAWMQVENLENDIAYLRLKVDPTDRPEVLHIKEGNFYLALGRSGLIRPIVDPEEIFGQVSDFTYPDIFLGKAKFAYPKNQQERGKTPCCMAYQNLHLRFGESVNLYCLAGNMTSLDKLKANSKRIANKDYLLRKQEENKRLILDLQAQALTHSSSLNFDLYCKQNLLDNLMRGGRPLSIGNTSIQVYSRRHGDLERDYNKFLIEPTYFSQGNGNFRDANQNRRSDIWLNPFIKEGEALCFFNLIQTDGYNPLVIKPDNFIFKEGPDMLGKFFNRLDIAKVKTRLEKPFTPGEILSFIEQNNIILLRPREEFLQAVLSGSIKSLSAEHGEGFWIDHWAYCLDLLESYLGVYPEKLREVLLEKRDFTFFDNPEVVRARREKYILRDKRVFQFHAVANSHAKNVLIKKRAEFPYLSRTQSGQGDIYKTCLIVKMLVVIVNRFASLDPAGVGVEMEADKPNWCDSLNGLPGLLGSSICETFELKRWVIFLKNSIKALAVDSEYALSLPSELYGLWIDLNVLLRDRLDDYGFWDRSHSLKEEYRQKTLMGFSGQEKEIRMKELSLFLDNFLTKLDAGLDKAYDPRHKLHYSYFINEVTDYKVIANSEHGALVMPLEFKQKPLPLFLEGIVHCLRIVSGHVQAKEVFDAVRKSALYDRRLKMYKLNASLEYMPEEIGRCRAFTPGWLENESIWLHMEYKYLLELLKNGLYKEFYSDFKNVLIPFQDPGCYGRSILENSSFLVSSAFPNPRLRGNGFVARLSGSTSEFISIWLIICAGHRPFYLNDKNELCLEFKPILPAWLFSKKEEADLAKDSFAFKFLGKTLVVYHNPKRKATFGDNAVKVSEMTLKQRDRCQITIKASYIGPGLAQEAREGKLERIDILLA